MCKMVLYKGLGIAEFREGKGDAARIMCKKAAILSSCRSSEDQSKVLQHQVEDIVLNHFQDAIYVLESGEEDDWDAWVCPYWR